MYALHDSIDGFIAVQSALVLSIHAQSSSTCDRFWNPVHARICPQYLETVALIPLLAALCIVFCQAVGLLVAHRPKWTKSFVEEHPRHHEVSFRLHGRGLSLANLALLLFSLCGSVLHSITAWSSDLEHLMLFPALTWATIFVLVAVVRPKTTSKSLLALYAMTAIAQAIVMAELPPRTRMAGLFSSSQLVMSICSLLVIINMPIRSPNLLNEGISRVGSKPTFEHRSPEDNLTMLQFLTVSWMAPLVSLGRRQQLNDEDVWFLPYEFQHTRLHETFRELRGSVIGRLVSANSIDLIILALLGIMDLVANLSVPILLQQLLRAMGTTSASRSAAITYATLSMVVRLIAAQTGVLSLWYGRRCYERSRGEMITMLFEKTLKRKMIGDHEDFAKLPIDVNLGEAPLTSLTELENPEQGTAKSGTFQKFKSWMKKTISRKQPVTIQAAKESASMGKILNLMRNDVYEVAQRFWEFQNLITKPIGLIFSVILIWQLIGWPCLVGALTVCIGQAINTIFARQLLKWERIRRVATDSKLQKVSQFVETIRHLRWYGWQDTWCFTILEARQKELGIRIITGLWNIGIYAITELASSMFTVVAFYAYTVLAGKPLRLDIAFPAIQLFGILENSLREIPNLITVLLNAKVAMGRIQDFMNEPDMVQTDDDITSSSDEQERRVAGTARDRTFETYRDHPENETSGLTASTNASLQLVNASFSWPGRSSFVLENVSLSFSIGLSIVCGVVGSGKTALLQALLGELDIKAGSLHRPDEMIGYCAQTPWLQSMSIRDNILFSAPFEEQRYKDVLNACALVQDLANFKHGDRSQIGENGIGLSGGQRARVALARAVYSKARVLLLDDPISALDHQTAELVVKNCLTGKLVEGRTVVLVTHRVHICKKFASQIVQISGGQTKLLDLEASMTADGASTPDVEEDTPEVDEKDQTEPEKFLEDEFRAHGGVKTKVYWEYIKAGKLKWWFILIIVLAFYRLTGVLQSWFLKAWGEAYTPIKSFEFELPLDRLPSPEEDVMPWLIRWAMIKVGRASFIIISQCFVLVIVYATGRQMFKDVMVRVSHSTFRFYDVTPVGRLMNRLTSDINTIDGDISGQFFNAALFIISWLTSLIVIASVTPVFLIFSLFLVLLFLYIFLRFLPTSQSLRRLEMTSLSPLMSNFGALVHGLTTVRAFQAQHRFQKTVIAVTDNFQKMDHFYWSLQAWLMYRFDIISALSTLAVTLIAIYTGVSSGLTAFVLIAATDLVSSTHYLCRTYGQLQMDFVSVERVVELLHLQQEQPGKVDPPAAWPKGNGDIVFENVTLQYAPHLDPSLQNITLLIPAGKTTAIIGRTGSGKSTLAMALLATILPSTGKLTIDNLDITTVSKQILRERITFVAQDPVLFPGTMRKNLDPMDDFSNEECESVLGKIAGRFDWTLNTNVQGGGRNFSQGQRQLIGLARTLLRRSGIVVLDEATASIDIETAEMIQDILAVEMKGSTVVTIAHRLEAVKNAEWCVVLEKGRVLRQGTREEMLGSES